eukprot:5797244-Prymnesium_polylepis.1
MARKSGFLSSRLRVLLIDVVEGGWTVSRGSRVGEIMEIPKTRKDSLFSMAIISVLPPRRSPRPWAGAPVQARRRPGNCGNLLVLPDTQEGTVPHRDRPAHVPWSV